MEEKAVIGIEDFLKVDLRIAKVISAEKVEGSDKLLKLTVSLGNEERTIVAGIAKYYSPEELVGKKIVIVANLKPRKIFGIESQGMLLAASDGEKLSVIVPDRDIPEGAKLS
ncbi:MAG: methionine--tRNA ligase subunit beta [Aquifex sp.]|nr:MAG: methionine--tRNA ligase subunit beta [Aquifex sp.]